MHGGGVDSRRRVFRAAPFTTRFLAIDFFFGGDRIFRVNSTCSLTPYTLGQEGTLLVNRYIMVLCMAECY